MATAAPFKTTISSGQRIELGKEIGRGGEGSIYDVKGHPDVVAKIFHTPPDPKHSRKLRAMVNLSSDRIRKVAAWPVDTLASTDSGSIAGILLPHAGKRKPVHELYGSKSRLQKFPDSDWRFLMKAAENAAIAVNIVHSEGHIIGDINEQNLLIADDATIFLIDCDSYQISDGGDTFTCDVGVLTFTPPELHGRHLRELVRNKNHDHFSLAVLIFQLLCMGRHPFAGRFRGPGEMPIEKAIREGRYAYGTKARSRQMEAPPGSLPISELPSELQGLFERAFDLNSSTHANFRPSSEEWITSLRAAQKKARQCSQIKTHYYLNSEAGCPWCRIKRTHGINFFPEPIPKPPSPPPEFDLAKAWQEILAVRKPGSPPHIPIPAVQPTDEAVAYGNQRLERRRAFLKYLLPGSVVGGIALFPILTQYLSAGAVMLLGFVAATIFYLGMRKYSLAGTSDVRERYEWKYRDAQSRFNAIQSKWAENATADRFTERMKVLKMHKTEFERLTKQKRTRIKELEVGQRNRQFHEFLKRNRIIEGAIPAIGPGRIAKLRSRGIVSAADVTGPAVIHTIPSFGEKLTQSLLDWRRNVERRFKYDPTKGLSSSELTQVDAEFQPQMERIAEQLRQGSASLDQIRKDIQGSRETLIDEFKNRAKELAQAQANWNAL